MNRCLFVVVALVGFTSVSLAQEREKPTKESFLSVLKVGQPVAVKDNMGRYEITVMDDIRLGYKVLEVGTDYVTLEDAAGISELRIPITSIKAIVRFKGLRK